MGRITAKQSKLANELRPRNALAALRVEQRNAISAVRNWTAKLAATHSCRDAEKARYRLAIHQARAEFLKSEILKITRLEGDATL